jgi:hypothetical protein
LLPNLKYRCKKYLRLKEKEDFRTIEIPLEVHLSRKELLSLIKGVKKEEVAILFGDHKNSVSNCVKQ